VVAVRELCPYPVNTAIPIRVEQAAGKAAGMCRDNSALPWLQLDFPHVLAARAMLREQARPVSGTTDYFGAARELPGADLAQRPDIAHGLRAVLPESRPGVRAYDAELPHVFFVLARLMQPSPR
jgi:hypothetical protein